MYNYVDNFVNYLKNNNVINSEDECEKIKYSLSVISSESLKFIGLSLLFLGFRLYKYFVFSYVLVILTRTFSGGIHFYKKFQCFLFSILFFICSIIILPKITLNYYTFISIWILCNIIVLTCSPIFSKYRQFLKKKKLKFKLISFILTNVCFIVLIAFFYNTFYFKSGIWTLLLQNLQLFYAEGRIVYEKYKKQTFTTNC